MMGKKISETEKNNLKKRINASIDSIHNLQKFKRIALLSTAAIAIVLLSISLYNNTIVKTIPDVYKFGNDSDMVLDKGDVKLIIGNSSSLVIKEDQPVISYATSEDKITVNDKEVFQDTTRQSAALEFSSVVVPYGKRTSLVLSDGTKVWLNSGSKLTFPNHFNGKREVHLIGEAIFDVAHDSRNHFVVYSEGIEIEVLGTVFNVSNYPDDTVVKTALKSGNIALKYSGGFFKGSTTSEISPGTITTYNKNSKTFNASKGNVDEVMSWRNNVLTFKSQPLEDIVKKLSRYYNIKIITTNSRMSALTFSGSLEIKETIEGTMNLLKEITNLNFEKSNGQIIITNL